jgi:2-polyprenyl-3-methyl-5-hydroxy-6-metoxy-1,4-benzoquinol methylase
MMFGFGDEFTYIECPNCGCLQISHIPSDISRYYPSNYYSFAKRPETNLWLNIVKGRILRTLLFSDAVVAKVLQPITLLRPDYADRIAVYSSIRRVPLPKDSRILDVGCGSGQLLYTLKNLGFRNVLGCDPNVEENINYENGLKILKATIQEIEGKWDLIMFNKSFEHIPDQIEILQSVHNLLNDRGVCIITMPTTSSYAWKYYKTNWVQLDAPRHLYIHSLQSMRILTEQANLILKEVVFNSSAFQFWGSEQYSKNIPLRSSESYCENPAKSIFSRKQIRAFARKAAELNNKEQGDIATFYLRHN